MCSAGVDLLVYRHGALHPDICNQQKTIQLKNRFTDYLAIKTFSTF